MTLRTATFFGLLALSATAMAHDTWVQTNTNLVRTGDVIHVDLMLGNHGNHHRDFKLASKIDPGRCELAVRAPSGKEYDLIPSLVDLGYAPKEGFWSARFVGAEPGLHAVVHSLDTVVNHGKPIRAIKSGKAYFAVSRSLDTPTGDHTGFDRPLGHPFELVPETNPVSPMGPGMPIKVRLLFKGKPLPEARISFVPRGVELQEGFDKRYERTTDAEGRAGFTPKEGNYYLVVAHHQAPKESGAGYEATAYSAALTVYVPQVCPCCGE